MTKKLRELRKKAGYTQADMGKMLGLSTAGYRQKETGKRKISVDEAGRMAQILKKTMDEIFLEGFPSK